MYIYICTYLLIYICFGSKPSPIRPNRFVNTDFRVRLKNQTRPFLNPAHPNSRLQRGQGFPRGAHAWPHTKKSIWGWAVFVFVLASRYTGGLNQLITFSFCIEFVLDNNISIVSPSWPCQLRLTKPGPV